MSTQILEQATFAGGCFWCTEAIFKRVNGVTNVVSGYAGGKRENPTYEQVSTGATGHAESVQITFDPKSISYEKLLDIFWHTHNPTTLNQQDYDIGPQYRSVIFYHNDEQRRLAVQSKERLENSGTYEDPIVTEIVPFSAFYPAEKEHQNFYDMHRSAPYCRIITEPKIRELLRLYSKEVKEEYKGEKS